MCRILVADDHENTCVTLGTILTNEGHSVTTVLSGESALEQVQRNEFDIIITDLKLGDVDGIKVLSVIRELSPEAKVIIMTAFGSISSTVKAMKMGAYDYLTKPVHKGKILNVVNKILADGNGTIGKAAKRPNKEDVGIELVGEHDSMHEVTKLIREVSRVNVPVLILGESGTGKELVARSIHQQSLRWDKPFVAINCATLPDSLQDSELFGHVKGAFTGAVEHKAGLFEQANGGSILLDEIGEMTLSAQAKLLRILEDGEVRRVGGSAVSRVDTRVIASTKEDLSSLIKASRFRDDLYFRLNVIRITLPTLRDRISDLPLLVDYFVKRFADQYRRDIKGIRQETLKKLERYHWPGNVRELENTIKRAVILCKSDTIEDRDLGELSERSETDSASSISEMEKILILKALEETGWSNSLAAAKLGISTTTLWRRMKRFGLKNPHG